jgi:hypothetical protein
MPIICLFTGHIETLKLSSQQSTFKGHKMKKILVFVIRHGEREDEAQGPSKEVAYRDKSSKEDRYDPKLTPEGHWQATKAFENIVSALEYAKIKQVAVFTSPMRRAIGTAMMLSVAAPKSKHGRKAGLEHEGANDDYSGINFVLPACSDDFNDHVANIDSSAESTELASPIPIVVMNGLSDCTALVARMGGHRNLVRDGVLACAAMAGSAIDDPQNRKLCSTLDNIKSTALEHKSIRNCATTTSCASVQFWKITAEPVKETPWLESALFVPMAPPVRIEESQDQIQSDPRESLHKPSSPSTYHADERDSPIDEAVRMALEAGCEACIVSSHREEIRDLCKNRCKFRHTKIAIPYCCIGVFEVLIDDDNTTQQYINDTVQPLEWIMHDVVAPDQLRQDCIPSIIACWESFQGALSAQLFPITYPVIERTTQHLCEVRFLVDSLAEEKSINGIKSVTLTGVQNSKKDGSIDEAGVSFSVHLQIVKGHHSWLEFLGRLQKDTAHGTAELFVDGNEAKPCKYQVFVSPESQPHLPCPPNTIRIEVLRI